VWSSLLAEEGEEGGAFQNKAEKMTSDSQEKRKGQNGAGKERSQGRVCPTKMTDVVRKGASIPGRKRSVIF